MPRTYNPKWGEHGVSEQKAPNKFALNEIKSLKSFASFQNWEELELELHDFALSFSGWRQQNADGPTRAEARQALIEYHEQIKRENYASLFNDLNHRAQSLLLDSLFSLPAGKTVIAPHETQFASLINGALSLETVQEAANLAIEELAKQTGPDPSIDIALAVQLLADMFERATSMPATFFADEADGSPASDTGRFIEIILRQIDPTITPQRVTTELRRLVNRRKS